MQKTVLWLNFLAQLNQKLLLRLKRLCLVDAEPMLLLLRFFFAQLKQKTVATTTFFLAQFQEKTVAKKYWNFWPSWTKTLLFRLKLVSPVDAKKQGTTGFCFPTWSKKLWLVLRFFGPVEQKNVARTEIFVETKNATRTPIFCPVKVKKQLLVPIFFWPSWNKKLLLLLKSLAHLKLNFWAQFK